MLLLCWTQVEEGWPGSGSLRVGLATEHASDICGYRFLRC